MTITISNWIGNIILKEAHVQLAHVLQLQEAVRHDQQELVLQGHVALDQMGLVLLAHAQQMAALQVHVHREAVHPLPEQQLKTDVAQDLQMVVQHHVRKIAVQLRRKKEELLSLLWRL